MFRIKWKSLGTFLNELTWYTPPSEAASKKEVDSRANHTHLIRRQARDTPDNQ